MRFLAPLLMALAFLSSPVSAAPPELIPGIHQVEADMSFPGVSVTVYWRPCGQINAYYSPAAKAVIVCDELLILSPAVIRFAVAHEMAHAVIEQLNIPYTGSEEVAADELAAMVFCVMGHNQDVEDMALFFFQLNAPEDPLDDHPSDMRRAATLHYLAIGGYQAVVPRWNTLLGLQE